MIIGTQTGVMIQTLGVFSDLSLVWEEPVRSVLQLMQLVNFDFDIVKMQCCSATEATVPCSFQFLCGDRISLSLCL